MVVLESATVGRQLRLLAILASNSVAIKMRLAQVKRAGSKDGEGLMEIWGR